MAGRASGNGALRPDDRRHDRRHLPPVLLFSSLRSSASTRITPWWQSGASCSAYLSLSGPLHHGRAHVDTGGLYGTGDTKSPLFITLVAQIGVPLGLCLVLQMTGTLGPLGIWAAILLGHTTRAVLSIIRFRQGKWRAIEVGVASADAR